MANDHKDIFKRAVIVQLQSSIWQCSKMLDQSVMQKIGDNSEWLRGRKYVIDPQLLGPCRTAVHQARNMLKRLALPFPINSLYLVPKESLSIVDEQLQGFKKRFWEKFREFEQMYGQAREDARVNLEELFEETDYPENIERKFNFEWRYLALGVPSKASLLTPEIYDREKQKFQDLMEETRETAVTALREELGDLVGNLVERLQGNDSKRKVISGSMFNKLRDFLEDVGTKNIFEDDKLVQLCEEARSVIEGVSPYGLKYNDGLREKITEDMRHLEEAVYDAITDMPRRQIRVAKVAEVVEEDEEQEAA